VDGYWWDGCNLSAHHTDISIFRKKNPDILESCFGADWTVTKTGNGSSRWNEFMTTQANNEFKYYGFENWSGTDNPSFSIDEWKVVWANRNANNSCTIWSLTRADLNNGILSGNRLLYMQAITPTPSAPKIINNSIKPAATIGYIYSCTFAATGHPAPIFTISGLPSWLSFDAGMAKLTGTPTATGTTGPITLTATNSQGSNAVTFAITVRDFPNVHIEAENYSAMSGIATDVCIDDGGGRFVGWIDAGDWMDYPVNVSSTGSYTVDLRVASLLGGARLQLKSGSTVLATVDVPLLGDWQHWATVSTTVALSAGTQTLRVSAVIAGVNLNWMDLYNSGVTGTKPFSSNIRVDRMSGLDGKYKIYSIDASIVSPSAGRQTMKAGIYITQAKGCSVLRRMVEVR
jgi:hypothetical protein